MAHRLSGCRRRQRQVAASIDALRFPVSFDEQDDRVTCKSRGRVLPRGSGDKEDEKR